MIDDNNINDKDSDNAQRIMIMIRMMDGNVKW